MPKFTVALINIINCIYVTDYDGNFFYTTRRLLNIAEFTQNIPIYMYLTLIYPAHFEDVACQSGVNHIFEG